MDWIIKIAKDFLDQYTSIQQIISDGETSLTNLTESGLSQLQDKADALEELLQEWYNTHSNDIQQALTDALNDIASALSESIEDIPHWDLVILDYDESFPLSSIEFEGRMFNCPNDYNKHLARMFGPNYMEFPKVIENHDSMELIAGLFNSNDEMNDAFDEAILFLKNVNEIFQ